MILAKQIQKVDKKQRRLSISASTNKNKQESIARKDANLARREKKGMQRELKQKSILNSKAQEHLELLTALPEEIAKVCDYNLQDSSDSGKIYDDHKEKTSSTI